MSRRIYIFFILCLPFFNCFSQGQKSVTDSLYHEWETNPNDTLKIYALFWVIDYVLQDHYIDSAYNLTLQARDFALEKNLDYPIAYSYESLGHLSHMKSNYDSALHYDLLTLKKYQELGDSVGVALTLNSVGEDYFDREFYSQAYEYYYKSLKYAESIQDSLAMTIATYNIGRVLKEQGYYERALNYIDSSLQMSKNIGDEEGIAYSHFDIADIYMHMDRNDEAREKLYSALEISQTHEAIVLIPKIYNKLGHLFCKQEEYDAAVENFEMALEYNNKINSKYGIGESYHGLGNVYTSTGNYNKAEEYFKECLSLADEIKSSDLKSKCYLGLSTLFEKKGQISQALDYYKKYKLNQDTLFTSKKSEQLSQLQMEHATQQRDLEINLLSQQKTQQLAQIKQEEFIRNVLVVIVAFFVILLITLYRSSNKRRKLNKLLISQQHELEQQREELVELNKVKDKFFSIISHDLRSPINNLAGMSSLLTDGNLSNEETISLSGSIQKQLKHASKLLDNLMDWVLLQSNEIKIKKENVNMKNLVQENVDYFQEINDKNIVFVNKVDDVEVLADRNMVDLVIRNLLSNAFKFTEVGGKIIVNSRLENGKVEIDVTDSGIGVPDNVKHELFEFKSHYSRKGTANEKGTGLGLKLCKEFVERNGGKIWVESEEGKGSTFKFTLQKAA